MTVAPEGSSAEQDRNRLVRVVEPRPPFLRIPADWYRRTGTPRRVHRVVETRQNRKSEETRTSHPFDFVETVSRRVLNIVKVNAAAAELAGLKAFERSMRAMLLVEAHVLEGLPPSTAVLDALAIAWAIYDTVAAEEAIADDESDHSERHQRRVRGRLQDWPDTASATEDATALIRGPMTRKRRVALHRIVRWFMRREVSLTLPVREAIAKASGLLNRDGNWRDEVVLAQQGLVDPKIIACATARDRRLLDQTALPKIRNRKAFDKAVALAADTLLASKYAKVPDKPAGEVRAMWYQDRDGFIRSKPRAGEIAKAVGVRAATIRDWRKRPDWPDRVLLRATSRTAWARNRAR